MKSRPRLISALPGVFILAAILGWLFTSGRAFGEGAEKTNSAAKSSPPAKKNKKPKLPPFKVSAWCAFRNLVDLGRRPPKVDPEKNTQTRPASLHWGGFSRRGQWLALVVELQNTTGKEPYEGRMSIRLDPSKENLESGQKPYKTVYRQDFSVDPKSTKRYPFSVQCPEFFVDRIQIDISANGRPFQRFINLRDLGSPGDYSDDLIVVVSEDAGAFRGLLPAKKMDPLGAPGAGEQRGRKVAVVRTQDLPSRWHDLTLANLIIIDGPPREGFSDAQLEALEAYVCAGGHILISSGKDPARLAPGEGKQRSLAELAGVRVRQLTHLPNLDIGPGFRPDNAAWKLPAIEVIPKSDPGKIRDFKNKASGLREMVERDLGLGTVTLLTFSLRDELLKNWPGKEEIPLNILELGRRKVLFTYEKERPKPNSGWFFAAPKTPVSENASFSALRSKLDDSFVLDTPVKTPPRGMVASLLLLFLLASVPGNYLLFGWLKRREIAWLAVPAYAILFSFIAYYVGYLGQLGLLTVNEVSVVEAGPNQDSAVARTFLGVYAPRRGEYRVAFDLAAQAAPGHLVSASLHTRGLAEMFDLAIQQDGGELVPEDLLIQARSTRRLEVVHRVALEEGVSATFQRRKDGSGYRLRVRNGTEHPLLYAALIQHGPDGQLRGAFLGDLPAKMKQPLAKELPAGQGPAWKGVDQAFFGLRPVFRSARGEDATHRARAVAEYVRARVGKYGDAVLVAWMDGGLLGLKIQSKAPRNLQGLALFILPLNENVGKGRVALTRNWRIEFSNDADLLAAGEATWKRVKPGQRLSLAQRGAGAVLVLKLTPPPPVKALNKPVLTLRFRLEALTRGQFGAAASVPSSYAGRPAVAFRERTPSGRPRWKGPSGRLPAFHVMVGQKTPPFTLKMPLTRSLLDKDGKIVLRFKIPKLKHTGRMDAGSVNWPLAISYPRIMAKGKSVRR